MFGKPEKTPTAEQVKAQIGRYGRSIRRTRAYKRFGSPVLGGMVGLAAFIAFAANLNDQNKLNGKIGRSYELSVGNTLDNRFAQFIVDHLATKINGYPTHNKFTKEVEARKKAAYEKLAKESGAKELLEVPIGVDGGTVGHFLRSDINGNNGALRHAVIWSYTEMYHNEVVSENNAGIKSGKLKDLLKAWDRMAEYDPFLNRAGLWKKEDESFFADRSDLMYSNAMDVFGLLRLFLGVGLAVGAGAGVGVLFQRRKGKLQTKLEASEQFLKTLEDPAQTLLREGSAPLQADQLVRPVLGAGGTLPGELLRATDNGAGSSEGRVDTDQYTKSSAPNVQYLGGPPPAPGA